MKSHPKTGGQILIDVLLQHGVDHVFCVAGESYIAALDALYEARDRIKLISCRHESGAAFMAEAYGKLTGKPGICFVTRGPGACNASIGIHTAFQDQTPLILFIGQVAREVMGREGFQEVDFEKMFAPLAKWAVQIDSPARVAEITARAFELSQSGRRGPIAIALPEDVLSEEAAAEIAPPAKLAAPSPKEKDIPKLQELLQAAQKPMMILGGGGWSAQACADLQEFAEANHIPTACAFRRQDLMDNRSPAYVGDLGFGADAALVERMKQADLILAVGDRIGEVTSREYTAFDIPKMKATLIHVQPDAAMLNHVYKADLPIHAAMPSFAAAVKNVKLKPSWQEWAKSARVDYEKTLPPQKFGAALEFSEIMTALNAQLPKDTIITNDAGNFSGWLHRYYQWRQFATQLAPCNGAMGYAVPSAVAASIVYPNRLVLGFAGDGGFLMTGQEIATAMQYKAKPILIVCNNNMYGTIRMHQEKQFPGRTIATDLTNPDFAALTKSYGAFGATVTKTAEFAPAFEAARNSGTLALIELRLDPNIISSRAKLKP